MSVARESERDNAGESGYVGYEMWVRDLETRVSGIVGASGCFYAIRVDLHARPVPPHLSRDFAASLTARENGYRAVSVRESVCYVPRTASLRREYRRKIRTMTRGMQTLWYKRALLHPWRHGLFAWALFSHKVCRWLVPPTALLSIGTLAALAAAHAWAAWALAAAALGAVPAAVAWLWPQGRPLPKMLAFPAYFVLGNVAALVAWLNALRGRGQATWEPTRRSEADEPARTSSAHAR